MKVKVFTKCLETKYFNTFFSKATTIVLILSILSIVLPFIIAYNSKGFWLKRDSFYEQPNIKYKYEYIFVAETNKLNSPIFCTNIFETSENENMDFCSETRVRERDTNFDGINDELNFTIYLNNLQDIKISGITLILSLNYKLNTECNLEMESYAIIQHFHSAPIIELNLFGDINLSQKSPIPCSKYRTFNNYNISGIKRQMTDLKNVFTEEYFTRKISTIVQNSYVAWKAGTGSTFEFNVRLNYPEHNIYYTPQFWQVVKFAWIQYLSMYVLFAWLIHMLKDYIFARRFVSYYVDTSSYNKKK